MKSRLAMMLLHILDISALWLLLCCGCSWGTEDFTPIREGTRFTMNCSGRTRSAGRHIVWLGTWGSNNSVSISTCVISSCINTQDTTYKGAYFPNGREYSSQLTILNVSVEHRSSSFKCVVLDYIDRVPRLVKAWILAGVYLPPQLVDCHTAILTDLGDILVWCQIDNFYPDIVCQMTISFEDEPELGPIRMQRHDVVNSSSHYYNSNCSHVVYANESGLYTFSVSVFPNVGNNSVTAGAIKTSCQSNVTLNPSININELSGDTKTCPCPLYRYIECRAAWFDHGVPRFLWYLDGLKVTEGIAETNIERTRKYYTYVSILKIISLNANVNRTVKCIVNFTNSNLKERMYSDSKTFQICHPLQTAHYKLSEGSGTVLGEYEIFKGNTASFVCEVKDSRMELLSMTVVCELSSGAPVIVSNTTSVALSFTSSHTTYGAHCSCSTRSSDKCDVSATKLTFKFGQSHPLPRDLSVNQAHISVMITLATLVVIAFILASGCCIFISQLPSSRNACPFLDKISEAASRRQRSRPTKSNSNENIYACVEYQGVTKDHSENGYSSIPELSTREPEASIRYVQSSRHLQPQGSDCSQQLHKPESLQVAYNHPSNAPDIHHYCDVELDRSTRPMISSFRDNPIPPGTPLDMEASKLALKYPSPCPHNLLYCRTHAIVHEDNYIRPVPHTIPHTPDRQRPIAPDVADSSSNAEGDGNSVTYISPCCSPLSSTQDLHSLDAACCNLRTLSDGTLCHASCEDMFESPYITPASRRSSFVLSSTALDILYSQ